MKQMASVNRATALKIRCTAKTPAAQLMSVPLPFSLTMGGASMLHVILELNVFQDLVLPANARLTTVNMLMMWLKRDAKE